MIWNNSKSNFKCFIFSVVCKCFFVLKKKSQNAEQVRKTFFF